MSEAKSIIKRKRDSISIAKRPELRLRLEPKEQDLLAELQLEIKAPVPDVVRQALANELARIREGRNADRLDTLRSSVVGLQEQVAYQGRRVEASIEIARSIEKQILGALDELKAISTNSAIRLMGMIESQPPERRAQIERQIEEIVRRG